MKLAFKSISVLVLSLFLGSATMAATHTKVISKITDIYQLRSGKSQLLESEYEVGTFNELDGMATDIQTLTEKEKIKANPVQRKLDRIIKISGSENLAVVTKKISSENCTTNANRKYCSTSIELTF